MSTKKQFRKVITDAARNKENSSYELDDGPLFSAEPTVNGVRVRFIYDTDNVKAQDLPQKLKEENPDIANIIHELTDEIFDLQNELQRVKGRTIFTAEYNTSPRKKKY